jgi:thioredoxin 1
MATLGKHSNTSQHKGGSQHITNFKNLEKTINEQKTVIVKCSADWCGPCKKIQPFFNSLAEEHKDEITFVSINIDNPSMDPFVSNFNISSIPTFILFHQGESDYSFAGANTQDLQKMVERAKKLSNE